MPLPWVPTICGLSLTWGLSARPLSQSRESRHPEITFASMSTRLTLLWTTFSFPRTPLSGPSPQGETNSCFWCHLLLQERHVSWVGRHRVALHGSVHSSVRKRSSKASLQSVLPQAQTHLPQLDCGSPSLLEKLQVLPVLCCCKSRYVGLAFKHSIMEPYHPF